MGFKPAFLRRFLFWPQAAKIRAWPARSGAVARPKKARARRHVIGPSLPDCSGERTLAQATRPILGLMKSAWLNLRRSWYFVGPYSDTADFTIMGPPPYFVLSKESSRDELGRTIRMALDGSRDESVSGDDAFQLAEERTRELARLAGVKDRRTFERGPRLVHFDCVSTDEILITPTFRKRGYWEPVPEAQWCRARRPSDSELGVAAVRAVARSTA